MKRKILIITTGAFTTIHGLMHILQFLQSTLMITTYSNSSIHEFLEHPIFGIIWCVLGLVSLYIGLVDFKFHKHAHKPIDEKEEYSKALKIVEEYERKRKNEKFVSDSIIPNEPTLLVYDFKYLNN